jgi:uncharacterized damage-inducible protein DinB
MIFAAYIVTEWKGTAMSDTSLTITFDEFRKGLLFILDETFDNVHGAFLDPGDSLFPTLAEVSAGQASQVVGGEGGNSIAGQVNHIIFYLDLAMRYMRGENPGRQDWSVAWRLVEVNDDEWESLKQRLRETQERLIGMIHQDPPEITDEVVGGAMAMLAHTAFHLGQIRHALSMLGADKSAGISV